MLTGHGMNMNFGGAFSISWLGVVIMAFIYIFARKWIFEDLLDAPFALWTGLALGVISYVLTVNFLCSYKIALVVGLIVTGLVGYFAKSISEGMP